MCYTLRDIRVRQQKTGVQRDTTVSTQAIPYEPAANQPVNGLLQRLFGTGGRKPTDQRVKKTVEIA